MSSNQKRGKPRNMPVGQALVRMGGTKPALHSTSGTSTRRAPAHRSNRWAGIRFAILSRPAKRTDNCQRTSPPFGLVGLRSLRDLGPPYSTTQRSTDNCHQPLKRTDPSTLAFFLSSFGRSVIRASVISIWPAMLAASPGLFLPPSEGL